MRYLILIFLLIIPITASAFDLDFLFPKKGKPAEVESAPNNAGTEDFKADENEDRKQDRLTLDKVDAARFYRTAILQILNKTLARSTKIEAKVGEETSFKKLKIKVYKCWNAPDYERPDSRALLSIEEFKNGSWSRVFYGWMVAASPSAATMEHPVYDVTVIKCKN